MFHMSEDGKFNKAAKFPAERKFSCKNKVLVKLPSVLNGPFTLLGPSANFWSVPPPTATSDERCTAIRLCCMVLGTAKTTDCSTHTNAKS